MKHLLALSVLIATLAPAAAQDKPTVESLLKAGYQVVNVFPSSAGPGVVLVNDDNQLMMCFVSETPQSQSIDTQYCKPVH